MRGYHELFGSIAALINAGPALSLNTPVMDLIPTITMEGGRGSSPSTLFSHHRSIAARNASRYPNPVSPFDQHQAKARRLRQAAKREQRT